MNETVVVSAIGIVVSGVVGPVMTSWAGRRADAQRFERDQAGRRRDDLRAVVDDAARLLALGATNVRLMRQAQQLTQAEPPEVTDWASDVHALEQRLLIRVSESNAVAVTYRAVREALIALGRQDDTDADVAVREFEAKRVAFLDAARRELKTDVA